MNEIVRHNDERIDELEAELIDGFAAVDCPVIHKFCDKMYIREIFMAAGTLLTSRIHVTEHPFVVSMGKVSVKIDNGEWELIEAPYSNITKEGTRRILYIHNDTIWTTFHVNLDNCTDVEEIEKRILEPHINSITGTDIHKEYLGLLNSKKEALC